MLSRSRRTTKDVEVAVRIQLQVNDVVASPFARSHVFVTIIGSEVVDVKFETLAHAARFAIQQNNMLGCQDGFVNCTPLQY